MVQDSMLMAFGNPEPCCQERYMMEMHENSEFSVILWGVQLVMHFARQTVHT